MSMINEGPPRPPRPPKPPIIPRPPKPPIDREKKKPSAGPQRMTGSPRTQPAPMPDGREFMDRITGGRNVSPAPMPDGREFIGRVTGNRGMNPAPMPSMEDFTNFLMIPSRVSRGMMEGGMQAINPDAQVPDPEALMRSLMQYLRGGQ